MFFLTEKASRIRLREAQRARDNRAEIVKALSHGQITRRDLYKWGIFTTTGALALKNGLSPFAPSAFADGDVPTGTPPSPLFGARKFTQVMPRLQLQTPIPLTPVASLDGGGQFDAAFPSGSPERPSASLTWAQAGAPSPLRSPRHFPGRPSLPWMQARTPLRLRRRTPRPTAWPAGWHSCDPTGSRACRRAQPTT